MNKKIEIIQKGDGCLIWFIVLLSVLHSCDQDKEIKRLEDKVEILEEKIYDKG